MIYIYIYITYIYNIYIYVYTLYILYYILYIHRRYILQFWETKPNVNIQPYLHRETISRYKIH